MGIPTSTAIVGPELLGSVEAMMARAIGRLVGGADAVSMPLLNARQRRRLHRVASQASWSPVARKVGPSGHPVHQAFELAPRLPAPIQGLAAAVNRQLNRAIETRADAGVRAFAFNEWRLQYYAVGGYGITPHRDHKAYRHLVGIVVLAGRGRFIVCNDRAARGAEAVPAPAGWLILMRASGFGDSERRPFHGVLDVEQPRYMLSLRCLAPPGGGPARREARVLPSSDSPAGGG